MDTTHIHLLLDRIREQQHFHGALLQDLAERQEEGIRLMRAIFKVIREKPSSKPSRVLALLPHGVVSTGLQYAVTLAALIFMLRGGDLEKLAGLAKLFGGP